MFEERPDDIERPSHCRPRRALIFQQSTKLHKPNVGCVANKEKRSERWATTSSPPKSYAATPKSA
jgi:hypothetical protein